MIDWNSIEWKDVPEEMQVKLCHIRDPALIVFAESHVEGAKAWPKSIYKQSDETFELLADCWRVVGYRI